MKAIKFSLAMFVFAFAAVLLGWGARSDEAKRVSISLKELEKKDNSWTDRWRLTEFEFWPKHVSQIDTSFGINVWIPIHPTAINPDAKRPADADLRDVLCVNVNNNRELLEIRQRKALNVQLREKNDLDASSLLALKRHHYNGLNPMQCRVITVDGDGKVNVARDFFVLSGCFAFAGLACLAVAGVTRTPRWGVTLGHRRSALMTRCVTKKA